MINKMISPSIFKRILFFGIADVFLICISLYLAFLVRLDFDLHHFLIVQFFTPSLPFFLTVKILLFLYFGMYHITWKYVGLKDLYNIVKAITFSSFIIMAMIYYLKIEKLTGFPRSIILVDALICLFLVSGVRISKRLFTEGSKKGNFADKKRTLIIGGGNTGEIVLRDMIRSNFNTHIPIGILDDDRTKLGTFIHGVKILGKTEQLPEVIKKFRANSVIIAIPKLSHKTLKAIYLSGKEANICDIKIVPRLYDFQQPQINLKSLEDIKIEDLIGREPIEIDHKSIEKFLKGKRILVTGGGGSIGSEVVLQICGFYPERIVVFDIDETAIYHLEIKIKKKYPDFEKRIVYMVGDVKDVGRVKEVFEMYRPEVVYHAAAYKHVPMMETNRGEAIKVNIMGTYNLARIAKESKVKKFTLISTDKAVNPTSIMGATKRMAEYICKSFNDENCEFISVRFGNVLGSRGSVLPLFMDQLKEGGPLTVTHKDIERYFMTIPEAVSLVLQASVVGNGGDILVLDMGEPVKIVKLAEDLIKLHGFKPYEDISIVFSGLRPGEKLFEELLTAEEGSFVTRHKKIFKAKISEDYSLNEIEKIVEELKKNVYLKNSDEKEIINILKKYIKWYRGADTLLEGGKSGDSVGRD